MPKDKCKLAKGAKEADEELQRERKLDDARLERKIDCKQQRPY